MRKRGLIIILGFIVAFAFIQTTAAHVPLFMEGGHSLDEAVPIENPIKSWVIYSLIHEAAEPHYFYFDMPAGEHIRLMLLVTVPDGNLGFRPRLALMGNGLTNLSTAPDYLEIPSGAQVMILEPSTPHPEYEGFTPTSFYQLYDLDLVAPTTGRYFLAYYEPNMPGNFAIAFGYQEIFSFTEWVTVPLTVITTHLWNRQSLVTLLVPVLLSLIIGLGLIFWRYPNLRSTKHLITWSGLLTGLLFLASGIFLLYQMGLALLLVPANFQIAITLIFAALPLLFGGLTLRSFLSTDWQNQPRQLLLLYALAILSLFLWAGWILGPILLLITATIPSIQLLLRRKSGPPT